LVENRLQRLDHALAAILRRRGKAGKLPMIGWKHPSASLANETWDYSFFF
jgi:hypothetical protein